MFAITSRIPCPTSEGFEIISPVPSTAGSKTPTVSDEFEIVHSLPASPAPTVPNYSRSYIVHPSELSGMIDGTIPIPSTSPLPEAWEENVARQAGLTQGQSWSKVSEPIPWGDHPQSPIAEGWGAPIGQPTWEPYHCNDRTALVTHYCAHCWQQGHNDDECPTCPTLMSPPPPPTSGRCHHCGQVGHFRRDCPHRQSSSRAHARSLYQGGTDRPAPLFRARPSAPYYSQKRADRVRDRRSTRDDPSAQAHNDHLAFLVLREGQTRDWSLFPSEYHNYYKCALEKALDEDPDRIQESNPVGFRDWDRGGVKAAGQAWKQANIGLLQKTLDDLRL